MRIEKVMNTEIDYLEVPGTREDVLRKIKETDRMGFPVVKKGTMELVGLVTQTDLMLHPDETQIGVLMARDPVTLRPGSPVWRAAKIFLQEEVRRIPITTEGKLVGLLSVHDLIKKIITRREGYEPIKPLIKRRITCVWQNTPLQVAAEIMRLSQKQLVPVLDNEGEVVGTISIGDLLRYSDVVLHQKKSSLTSISEGEKWTWDTSGILYIEKRSLQLPTDMVVKDAMSPELITVNEHTSIVDCGKKMHETKLDSLPVMTTESELGGIIRDIDLLKILLPADSEPNHNEDEE